MRLFNSAICIVGILYVMACANISSPSGGPRDETPPELITSVPRDNSTNVRSREIVFEFDEYIRLDGLSKQLIITPRLDINYKSQVRKNVVTITFDEPLPENTTFTLNFREAVKDITEGNPAENLRLAFSTGPFIDSLSLSGQVNNLLTNKPVEKAIVGLYPVDDTITVFNGKPYYFTQTDGGGTYTLENLKPGEYNVYAWNDKNDNLELNSKNEGYAFLPDPITIQTSDSIETLNIIQYDFRELLPIYSRTAGNYYEVKFNKGIQSYDIRYPESDSLIALYKQDQNLLRWYPQEIKDSVQTILSVTDSLSNTWTDTLYVKFENNSRSKPEAFTFSIDPKEGKISRSQEFNLTFTKPVIQINLPQIMLAYDSLNTLNTDTVSYTWNASRTILTLSPDLSKTNLVKYDSTNSPLLSLPDSTSEETRNQLNASIQQFNRSSGKTFSINFGSAAFISIENDSSQSASYNYTFSTPSDYGIIAGKINTDKDSYILQLLNANSEVVREVKNTRSYRFTLVPPGDYTLRVLIDENSNGQWDPGNISNRIMPEPVIFYDKVIPLKANWEVVDENISF
ncbi:Ig-like domain-containing protein [Roseivirga sp. BDSF3-8]|uniref:Ig-like domain-containing protein n=1 Tax=Roseivirga sp. BDSF3-8 TaxID=3241598 RepID=UPI0035319F9A